MLHRQSSSRSVSGTPWRYEQDRIEEPVCQASWGDATARGSHVPVLISQAGAERAGCVGSLHRRGAGQGCAVFVELLSGAVAHENRALPSPFLKDAECSVRGSQVGSAQARCQGRKGKPAFSHTWGGPRLLSRTLS